MIKKVKMFCIMLPKMNGYVKCFGKTKSMSFFIRDREFSETYK